MATARLIPSQIYNGSSNYLTISSQSNMFTNTDSTNYGTVQNTRSSTSSYYVYLRGFNFDSVPNDAIVSSIEIKIKAYQSGGNTSTIYMYNGTSSQVSACGSTTALETSASVKTFTNTTIDWDTMKEYGSDLGIRINCRRRSRNTTSYIYIYGAEIDVTYTVPVYHTVTITGNNVSPSGTQSVLEGTSLTIQATGYSSKPTVTDNNVDVTSQVTSTSNVSSVLIPESNTNSGWYSVTDISKAYASADSTDYAQLQLAGGGTTGTIYLNLSDLSLPSGATIQSVSCQATLQYNRNNSSSGFTCSCQMYAGSTAKGSSITVVSAGGTDVAKTTFNLTVGNWTATEINNARFYLTATNNASSTRRYIYIYGISFTVTYQSDGVIYIYTLSNITTDHTVVFTAAPSTNKIFIKNNGSWSTQVVKAYKKVNGTWVEQSDLTTVFNSNTNYVKGN